MTTDTQEPTPFGELSTDELQLISHVRSGNHRAASNLIARKLMRPDWTYEHRLALAVLARLALSGALSTDLLNSPSSNQMEDLIDQIAETLEDGLQALGGYSSLQKLLDDASLAPDRDGAE